jgi:hypothetical protein
MGAAAANVPGMRGHSLTAPGLLAVLLVGCAHQPPAPIAPGIAPAANPAAPVVAPHRAAGSYLLTTTLPASGRSRPHRGHRAERPARAVLRLAFQPVAAPDATAASSTQLGATVSIPGYTQAPPGRVGQAAAWWPSPGDSVTVHFRSPRGDGTMELRGTLHGDSLSGEVWFTSATTGSAYQMGTFLAVKRGR